MKNIRKKILFFLFSISILSFLIYDNINRRQLNVDARNCTVGILELEGRNKIFNYSVNGIKYQLKKKRNETYLISGEKYRICYEQDNPSFSNESLTHPIIDTNEYIEILSNPINAELKKGPNFISYNYLHNSSLYKRGQKLFVPKDLSIVNKRFIVWVNKTNPNISYINLQKTE